MGNADNYNTASGGKHINCKKCRHYYITWDRRFPYGCRALQFKSARSPALEVFAASGIACLHFEEKKQ